MARPKKKHHKKTRNKPTSKGQKAKGKKRVVMTALEYCIGIGFAVTLGLAIAFYQMNKPRAAVVTGLVCWIFVGVGLSAVSWRQIATDEQPATGDVASRALEKLTAQGDAQLRPYVGVSYVKATLEIGKPISILIKFTNNGKSPAEDVEVLERFTKVPTGSPLDLNYDGREFQRRSRGHVNVGNTVDTEIVGHEWTLEELMQLTMTEESMLFAHGVVRYRSKYISGGSDETPFCYEFDKTSGQMVICRVDTSQKDQKQGQKAHKTTEP